MNKLDDQGISIGDFIELCDNSTTMKQASEELNIPFNEFIPIAIEFHCWRSV